MEARFSTFHKDNIVMFGKKPQSKSDNHSTAPEQSTQSQKLSGLTITGGSLQVGQVGGDLQQTQVIKSQLEQPKITAAEVVKQLEQLIAAVSQSALTEEQKEDLLLYLKVAKKEVAKELPNKSLVAEGLKSVSETLQTLNETTEAGTSLWQIGVEVFKAVAPWAGVAVSVFGV